MALACARPQKAAQVKGVKMAKLNKVSVAYISLVKSPANKLDIVYKSSDAKFTDEKQIKITKSEPEGIVYGTVYEPNVKDSDGDWADKETIRKAAHDFLMKGANAKIDENHNEQPIGATVVESSINEKGAWEVAIKMDPKSETFQKVQKGELKGLSMGAYCQKSEEEPPTSEESNPVLDLVKELSTKVEKMAGDLAAINSKVDKVPKSRQLTIDGEHVKIDKNSDDACREFSFSDLD